MLLFKRKKKEPDLLRLNLLKTQALCELLKIEAAIWALQIRESDGHR